VVGGTITGLRNYGAFLELEGGMAGLLHISQISYDRVDNLETLFTIGQKCKVMILDHDKANGRVALSTKTLEPAPGDMLKNMENVFSQAEATAARYHERIGKIISFIFTNSSKLFLFYRDHRVELTS
jgi:small subunit ribosomal protein S1